MTLSPTETTIKEIGKREEGMGRILSVGRRGKEDRK